MVNLLQAVGPVTGTSLTSLPVTLAPTTPGSTLIVCTGECSTGSNPAVSAITLGGSGTGWGTAVTAINGSGVNAEIWKCAGAAGGQTALAITFAGGSGSPLTCAYVYEVAALAGTADKTSPGINSSGSPTTVTSGPTATTASAAEFWVGIAYSAHFSAAQTWTPVGSWANGPAAAQNVSTSIYAMTLSGYQISAAPGAATYSAIASASNAWSAAVATFGPVTGATAVLASAAGSAGRAMTIPGTYSDGPGYPADAADLGGGSGAWTNVFLVEGPP